MKPNSDLFLQVEYRAKAAEYRRLGRGTEEPGAVREFQRLERSFTELAENEDWLSSNFDKTVHSTDPEVR